MTCAIYRKFAVAIVWLSCGYRVAIVWLSRGFRVGSALGMALLTRRQRSLPFGLSLASFLFFFNS